MFSDIVLTTPLHTESSNPSSPNKHLFFSNATPSLTPVPPPPYPLIKLTDFGLSRFIDPEHPLLTTRCGSEAYAAPELVISTGRRGVASSPALWGVDSPDGYENNANGGYDARETDAWACGVVLYALVGRRLPFGEGPGEAAGIAISGEPRGGGRTVSANERRQWLMKIARGEWFWPEHDEKTKTLSQTGLLFAGDDQLRGVRLVESAGAKKVVEKLLVRDPSRRARIGELWDEANATRTAQGVGLFNGSRRQGLSEGALSSPVSPGDSAVYYSRYADEVSEGHIPVADSADEEEDSEEDVDHDGWLVDKEGIDNIARQEVL